MDELKDDENFIQNKFGYCFYSLSEPMIYNLYIHPKYRKQGYSKVLLNYIISEIRNASYNGVIYIEVEPREDSISKESLIKYYKNMGLSILN